MTASPAGKPAGGRERAAQVRTLFSEIAHRYDVLNHVLSLNIDRRWRRRAVAALGWERAPGGSYLDACAGTLDLALELAARPGFRGRVAAADFALPMLVRGLPKIGRAPVAPVCGDAQRLPFAGESFAGATVGFGVRNLSNLRAGFEELHRVLRPEGRLVILEFAVPPGRLLRAAYMAYFNHVLPLVGEVGFGASLGLRLPSRFRAGAFRHRRKSRTCFAGPGSPRWSGSRSAAGSRRSTWRRRLAGRGRLLVQDGDCAQLRGGAVEAGRVAQQQERHARRLQLGAEHLQDGARGDAPDTAQVSLHPVRGEGPASGRSFLWPPPGTPCRS